jgi:DNA mismatch repair ATPase MutL
MTDTPLIDANPTHYLKRIDRDTPPLQFIRELVQNGIEAGATEIKLKPRQWIYKKDEEVNYTYKMMIEDNGEGTSSYV